MLMNTGLEKITLHVCNVNGRDLLIHCTMPDINNINSMKGLIQVQELLPFSNRQGQNIHFEALICTAKPSRFFKRSDIHRKHFIERKYFLFKTRVKKKARNVLSKSSESITKMCVIVINCQYCKELIAICLIALRGDLFYFIFLIFHGNKNFCKSYPSFAWGSFWISCEKIINPTWQQMYESLNSTNTCKICIFNYPMYKIGNKEPCKITVDYMKVIQFQKTGSETIKSLLAFPKIYFEHKMKYKILESSGCKRRSLNYKIMFDAPLYDKVQIKTEEKSKEISNKQKSETAIDVGSKGHDCLGRGFRWSVYYRQYWSRKSCFQLLYVYPLSNQPLKPNPISQSAQEQRRPNNQSDAINNLMRYEVFRLCSFSFTQFPPNVDLWVTQLAQSGFYVVGSGGRIRCFSCGCEFLDFLVGSSIDNAHGINCQRHEYNRNLNEWTHGLSADDLAPYFNAFGSLTPNLFDNSGTPQQFGSSISLTPTVGRDHGSSAAAAINITQQGEYVNTGNEVSGTGFAELENYPDSPKPSSVPLIGNVNSSYVYFTSETRSLPTYLNTVSGALVSQESHTSNSREVLTSVARQPMSVDSAPNQRATNAQTQNGQDQSSSEEGAVGGSAHQSFDLSRASYPQFASSTARKTTFNGWNPDHPQRPDDLVSGGFFYAGYADCVRCFYCGLGLKYWRPNDIPAYQHARFRPHCVYNRMYKGQEYIDRVQQDIQNEQTNRTDAETSQTTTTPAPSIATSSTVGSTNSISTSDQDHAFLRLAVAQEALRAGWRREQVIQAITHIVDEIGITSQSIQLDILIDVLVSLFSANDQPEAPNLSSSDSDSTGDSHRNIGDRPVDPNIATVRPTLPVASKLAERSLGMELADGGSEQHADVTEFSDGPNTLEMTQAVERENAYLSQRTMCSICHERPVSCVFLPCGHVIACQPCADNSTTCVLCHKNIVATANIFLA